MTNDEFGGVLIEESEQDEFGGIRISDEFGGIPVEEEQTLDLSQPRFGSAADPFSDPYLNQSNEAISRLAIPPEEEYSTLMQPMIELPRLNAETGPMTAAAMSVINPFAKPTTTAGAINSLLGLAEGTTSIAGAAGLAAAPVVGPYGRALIGAGFGVPMALDVPEAAREAGRLAVEGTEQETSDSAFQAAANVLLPGMIAKGSLADFRSNLKPKPKADAGPRVDITPPPETRPMEPLPVLEPKTPTLAQDIARIEEIAKQQQALAGTPDLYNNPEWSALQAEKEVIKKRNDGFTPKPEGKADAPSMTMEEMVTLTDKMKAEQAAKPSAEPVVDAAYEARSKAIAELKVREAKAVGAGVKFPQSAKDRLTALQNEQLANAPGKGGDFERARTAAQEGGAAAEEFAALEAKNKANQMPVEEQSETSALFTNEGRNLADEASKSKSAISTFTSVFKGLLDAIPTRWLLNADSPRKPISEFGRKSLADFLKGAAEKHPVFSEASEFVNSLKVPATWLGGSGELSARPSGAAAGMMASFPVVQVSPKGVSSRVLVHEAAHLYYEMMPPGFKKTWEAKFQNTSLADIYRKQWGERSALSKERQMDLAQLERIDKTYAEHGLNAVSLEMFAITMEQADAIRKNGKFSDPTTSYYLKPDAGLLEAVDPLFSGETPTSRKVAPPDPPTVPGPAEVGPAMGADVRSDLNPLPPRGPTSIKNEVTEASRAELGLPPVEPVARRSFGRVWDSAMAAMDSDGNYQTRLIAELKQKARALTDTEDATLLHKQVDLQTEFAKASRDLSEAWEDGRLLDVEREQSRVDDLSNQLLELYDITKATGTETGRGLNARKMLANQDFTLASMVTQKRAAKGGAPLTPEETAKVTDLNKKIEETQGKLDEHIGKRQEKEALDRVEKTPKELDFSEEAQDIVATKIRDKVEAGDLDISNLVQRLARMFVAAGVRERGNLVTAVHGVLKTIDPMFTERDTMDAISGYGRFKQLKKGEVEEVLRDLKGQMQQVAKLEDIIAKQPLQKTGVERRTPSDIERRLIQQVNEAKRKYGVVDADPATTLKSALQQAKTFLTHRLSDLRQEIATRERNVKTKTPLKPDAELEALRAEYELVKAEHAEVFPKREMTPEQLAVIAERTLDRNIASLESDLSAGKLKRDPFVSRTPETQAILEKRAWLQALREHRKELWDNTPENMAEARANAIESKKNSVEKQIAELQRKLAEGDLNTPRNVRMNRPGSSPELEKLLLERDSLNTQLAEARKAARPRMTPEEKTTNALNKAIENLSERINTGDLLRKTGKPVSNPAIESLRATRTQLTDILKQLREASGMKEPKRLADALKRAEEAGAELERRINEGDIGARSKSAKPTTPEIEAARAENAELQKIVRALQREARPKKSPEEIALQTLKTRLTTANAEYQRRLNEGDFTTRKRNAVDISGDPAALRLKAENERLKNEFQRGKELDALKRRTRGQKLYAGAKETLNLPRTILSSWDLSAVLRQGGFIGLGNPVRAAKSIVPMLKSLVSERSALELEQQILSRANATLYAKSKLYLAPLDAIRLSAQEEQIMSRLAGKIPGIRASNRAFVSFLNKLRADSFDAMEAGLSKSGKATPEELAAISNYINVATGRGNLGKAAAAAETMATVFFSPRLLASRFQLAAGEPLYGGSARTRKAVAKEYAKALIGLSTVLALGALAGGELEDDPRSADFGKIKFGNTRVDPMMGLAQITVLMSRLASGETKTGGGKIQAIRGEDKPYAGSSAADVIARFLRSKLSPVIGTGVNIVSGENVVGEPTTPASVAKSTLVPLSFQDLQDVMVEQGIPKGTALEILQFFGMGLQHHEDRKKAPPR